MRRRLIVVASDLDDWLEIDHVAKWAVGRESYVPGLALLDDALSPVSWA